MITELKESIAKPIIFFRDFNKILLSCEKDGGNRRSESHMKGFREVVDVCGLQDLEMINGTFTWQRGMIKEHLDRFLANTQWLHLFLLTAVNSYPRYKSDHALILKTKWRD